MQPDSTTIRPKNWPWNSSRWRTLRRRLLASDPLCNHCNKAAATDVHHILPISLGGAPFDVANLQGVCRSCHLELTRLNNQQKRADQWLRPQLRY